MWRSAILGLAAVLLPAAQPVVPAVASATFAVTARSGPTALRFRAQMLPEPRRRVFRELPVLDRHVPAVETATGALEVGVGDGVWRSVARRGDCDLSIDDGQGGQRSLRMLLERDPVDGWVCRNQTVSLIEVAGQSFVLVDANANGRWNEPGIDGVAWTGSEMLFPLPRRDEAWCLPEAVVTHFSIDAAGRSGTIALAPLRAANREALAVLRGCNAFRVELGLTPRPERGDGAMQRVAEFMALQRNINIAPAAVPGAAPELSVAWQAASRLDKLDAFNAVDQLQRTFQYRIELLRPHARDLAIGFQGGYLAINTRGSVDAQAQAPACLLVPAPGQRDVPLSYQALWNVFACAGRAKSGYLISAQFPSDTAAERPRFAQARVVAVTPQGGESAPLPVAWHDSLVSPVPWVHQSARMVSLSTLDPLRPSTTYRVSLSATVAGRLWSRTWDFTTAASDGVARQGGQGGGGSIFVR